MHQNSKLIFKKYAIEYFLPRKKILEIGPDDLPSSYQMIVKENSLQWDTLDIMPGRNITFVASNEYSFPIPDESYDIVLSGNVIEHVRKIWLWVKELSRVCKTGGYIITINPVSWPYHEAPVDCWRIYPEGMRILYDEANIKTILARWESLEIGNYSRYVPGRSPEWQAWKELPKANRIGGKGRICDSLLGVIGLGWKKRQELKWRFRTEILHLLGGSVERAYDTIVIGQKLPRINGQEGKIK